MAHLSSMLASARLRSAGTRTLSLEDVTHFFTDTFPAALYRMRAWWLWTMAANVVLAWVVGRGSSRTPVSSRRSSRPLRSTS